MLQRQVCGKTASVLLSLLWVNLWNLWYWEIKCDKGSNTWRGTVCPLGPSENLNFILYFKTWGRKVLAVGLGLIFLQERTTLLERRTLAGAYLIWLTQNNLPWAKDIFKWTWEHGMGRSVLNRRSQVSSVVSVSYFSLEQDEMATLPKRQKSSLVV